MTGKRSRQSLLAVTFKTLKWTLLAAAVPRLCLTALVFCQPFLLEKAIRLTTEPITTESTNFGYGMIGAYVFVYVGISVS